MLVIVLIIGFSFVVYFLNKCLKENKKSLDAMEKILIIEEKREEKREEVRETKKRNSQSP